MEESKIGIEMVIFWSCVALSFTLFFKEVRYFLMKMVDSIYDGMKVIFGILWFMFLAFLAVYVVIKIIKWFWML